MTQHQNATFLLFFVDVFLPLDADGAVRAGNGGAEVDGHILGVLDLEVDI